MSFKITGLEKIRSKLEKIKSNAEAMHGTHDYKLTDVLTPEFLRAHSQFTSFDQMIEKSGFKVKTSEDFKAIPDEPWEAFIKANTSYSTWKEMLSAAVAIYAKKKILGT